MELREEFAWPTSEGTCIFQGEQSREWWTFAGLITNQTVANMLSESLGESVRADNLFIRLPGDCPLQDIQQAILDVAQRELPDLSAWAEQAKDLFKFSELLPPHLLTKMIAARLMDLPGAQSLADAPVVVR